MVIKKVPSKQAHIQLPSVHTTIRNTEKVMHGIHQHVKPEHLQIFFANFVTNVIESILVGYFDKILFASKLT
jgi:hypothetical protein